MNEFQEAEKGQYKDFYSEQATDTVETGDESDIDKRIEEHVLTKYIVDVILSNEKSIIFKFIKLVKRRIHQTMEI